MSQLDTFHALWQAMNFKNFDAFPSFFTANGKICWHNTDECFSPEGFALVNSHYPGDWRFTLEKLEQIDGLIISVAKVSSAEEGLSFHATSFYYFEEDKIARLDEYWGDDGPAPDWRRALGIARPIPPTQS